MNLTKTENFAIGIANMAFADLSQKREIKEVIMKEIAMSCLWYSKDPNFKREIDDYIQYQRLKSYYD